MGLPYVIGYKAAVLHTGICFIDDYSGIGCNGYPRINESITLGPRAKKYSVDMVLAEGGFNEPYCGYSDCAYSDWLTTTGDKALQ